MLSTAQVIALLTHDDPEVRSLARKYLTHAHDPAPATAEDFWAAADKLGADHAAPYVDRLGLVPQTPASVKRLLDELPKTDPATAESLLRTLERLKVDLLREHWDAACANSAVPQPMRAHLQARLDLANEAPEPLWDRLMDLARRVQGRDLTEAEELEIDRLIEAVSRRPDLFADRVLAALSDSTVKGWAEAIVADIAGEMRLEAAIAPLLDKLKDEEFDLLWEVAADALVHIGSAEVVLQIVEQYPGSSVGFRISGAGVLGRIKRPESQAAALQLLDSFKEDDADSRTPLVSALVDLLPDDAETFERLRAIARDGRYDRKEIHLDEELLTLSTMTGLELPERAEWTERITRSRAEWQRGMSNVDQLFQSAGGMGSSKLHVPPLKPLDRRSTRSAAAAIAEAPARQRVKPFKKSQPKVGRNDACPCGSGKKYKKCCGR